MPVRIDDAAAPPLLASLIAPSLHHRPHNQARAELLGAIRPHGRPEREPSLPSGTDEEAGPRLPGALPRVWGPVPGPNEAFTGRDTLFVRLRAGLQISGRSVVHALHGAGGVGKTQLAAEYAWRFSADYDAVWWVDAEQVDRIGEQYAAFAIALGLVDAATGVETAVKALRAYCGVRRRWLVVLDNATSARDVHPWMLPGPGHVLVTSRDPHWPEIAAAVQVDLFVRDESIALLQAHLPNLQNELADELARALGDLPLALAQAAGLLAETGMPVRDYLELLESTAADVLDEGVPISYPRSLAKSIRLTVDRLAISDQAGLQLLQLSAFLGPEPIPTTWFPTAKPGVLPEQLATTVKASLPYRRCLGLLNRLGIARVSENRFTIHRLTQSLLRADTSDSDHAVVTIERFIGGLAPGRPTDPSNWPAWADLLPHLRTLDLVQTDDDSLAWQACEAAMYLRVRGELQASNEMITPLCQAWINRFGPDALRSRWAVNHLAHSLSALGRSHEALALGRELFLSFRTTFGDDHPVTWSGANNLAVALGDLGNHDEAVAVAEDALARCRGARGNDHPDTLTLAGNLAKELAAIGEYDRAYALDSDTFARFRRLLGQDHPDTLRSANNLVNRLAARGEHEEARALAVDTLNRRQRIMGGNHPDTLRSANHVALRLANTGEHQQARLLAEETLAHSRKLFGENHPVARQSAEIIELLRKQASA